MSDLFNTIRLLLRCSGTARSLGYPCPLPSNNFQKHIVGLIQHPIKSFYIRQQ